ncbi:MAG TPA: hypothetical protein VMW64_03265 [Dehalococcoidia bacterium]|nr:hypothetical protein [Dehalococcoidia bacterium]
MIINMMQFRLISQLIHSFVLPEVEDRIKSGKIKKKDLPIVLEQFRVIQRKLSNGSVANIVELNKEVNLIAQIKLKEGVAKSPGEPVTRNEIELDQCFIAPPVYDGKPAAYFLCQCLFVDYLILLDLRPNAPDFTEQEIQEVKNRYPIEDFLNLQNYKMLVEPISKLGVLSDNNWPPAPGYYPQVLLELHKNPTAITSPSFLNTVSSAYGHTHWDEHFAFWEETKFFPDRLPYLKRAVAAHLNKDYIASIYIIVPQFEGIMGSYLAECGHKPKGDFTNYVRDLRKLILSRKILLFPREIFETIFGYLENGSFWKSTRTISTPHSTINRHGIVHGLSSGFECEEISLKYLILLDSLAFVLLQDRMLRGSI